MKIAFVILAGGPGQRLWPLSRRNFPKPLLSLNGGASLVKATVARVAKLAKRDSLWLVCTQEQAPLFRRHLKGTLPVKIIAEPLSRNTAPAIGLAAHLLAEQDPDTIMVILPSDHWISPVGTFQQAIQEACRFVKKRPTAFVTFGIPPTGPHTGYGYIKVAAGNKRGTPIPIQKFVEKPDTETATRYLEAGHVYWNSGMFVARAGTILKMIAQHLPKLKQLLAEWDGLKPRSRWPLYEKLPHVSIDVGLLEKGGDLWLQPVRFQWSDLGDIKELARLLTECGQGNRAVGSTLLHECRNTHVAATKRLVCALGLSDVAILETDEAVLVVAHDKIDQIKNVVRRLAEEGRGGLL